MHDRIFKCIIIAQVYSFFRNTGQVIIEWIRSALSSFFLRCHAERIDSSFFFSSGAAAWEVMLAATTSPNKHDMKCILNIVWFKITQQLEIKKVFCATGSSYRPHSRPRPRSLFRYPPCRTRSRDENEDEDENLILSPQPARSAAMAL